MIAESHDLAVLLAAAFAVGFICGAMYTIWRIERFAKRHTAAPPTGREPRG